MKNNSEEPAFPLFLQEGLSHNAYVDPGLTKREYFAGLAMQGIIHNLPIGSNGLNEQIAKQSISLVDELLRQLEK